jgi:hypothetical protein
MAEVANIDNAYLQQPGHFFIKRPVMRHNLRTGQAPLPLNGRSAFEFTYFKWRLPP